MKDLNEIMQAVVKINSLIEQNTLQKKIGFYVEWCPIRLKWIVSIYCFAKLFKFNFLIDAYFEEKTSIKADHLADAFIERLREEVRSHGILGVI